jgi:hypothetical protein
MRFGDLATAPPVDRHVDVAPSARAAVDAPPHLVEEMRQLLAFKTSTLTAAG